MFSHLTQAGNSTFVSPGHSSQGFSIGITWESVTEAMLHDMDISSLKTGHVHPVSSVSIKTTTTAVLLKHWGLQGELQRCFHPQAKKHQHKSNWKQGRLGLHFFDELGDRKVKNERALQISGQTYFLKRLRNYPRLIPCQQGTINFKSNGKLQRNYLNVIILILDKLNYAEDTMPLHRQWPHCCYMR